MDRFSTTQTQTKRACFVCVCVNFTQTFIAIKSELTDNFRPVVSNVSGLVGQRRRLGGMISHINASFTNSALCTRGHARPSPQWPGSK